jgi:hypothetical protein
MLGLRVGGIGCFGFWLKGLGFMRECGCSDSKVPYGFKGSGGV